VRRRPKARFGRPPDRPAIGSTGLQLSSPHPAGTSLGYLLLRRQISTPVLPAPLPEGLTLQPISADDATAAHHLLQLAYANGFGSVPDNRLDWWNALLSDPEFDRELAVVAKRNTEVVGFCLCWTSSFIKDLVVDPNCHGQGIGSALLANAIAVLARRGAEDVALKVDIYNAMAQRLYRRFGFVVE
jgi:ribosomal protein S18 acetylase RimI-like enzyme